MKRSQVFIFIAVFLSLLLIMIYIIKYNIRQNNNKREIYKSFAQGLDYNFCCRVLEIEALKQRWGYGKLKCELIGLESVNKSIEDTLRRKHREDLAFILNHGYSEVVFLVPGASKFDYNDSLCVSSELQSIHVFRNGDLIREIDLKYCVRDKSF